MISTASFPERVREFRAVFLHTLKKNVGFPVLYAVLQILLLPVIVLITLQNAVSAYRAGTPTSLSVILISDYGSLLKLLLPAATVPMALLFSLVLCVRLFGYMQDSRSVDLYHALPVGRVPMLLGRWCAGIAALFLPQALGFGILAAVARAYGIPGTGSGPFSAGFGLLWLMLGTAAAFSFSVFMAVCSGSMMDAVLSVLGVSAGYPVLILCLLYLAGLMLPGFSMENALNFTVLTLFAPFAAAFLPFLRGASSAAADGAAFPVWWVCFTAVLISGSCFLYRRRKSEAAGDHYAFPVPKAAIRFLLSAAGGLGFGLILKNAAGMGGFVTGVLSGSLTAHLIVEAVYSRGFRGIHKSLPWYGAFLALFAVFYGVLAAGFFGYTGRIPEKEQVEEVSVEAYPEGSVRMPGIQVYRDSVSGVLLKKLTPKAASPESVQKIIGLHRKIVDLCGQESPFFQSAGVRGSVRISLNYRLKNGKHFIRNYQYTSTDTRKLDEYQKIVKEASEIPEIVKSSDFVFYAGPEDIKSIEVSLLGRNPKVIVPDQTSCAALLSALQEDLRNGKANFSKAGEKTVRADLTIFFQDKTTPSPDFRKALGSSPGTVYIPPENYTFFNENSATYQLMKKMHWNS